MMLPMRALLIVGTAAGLIVVVTSVMQFWPAWQAPQALKAAAGKTTDQRAREGAYVASEKALSASEDLRLVVIPSPLGAPLDVKCFLYRNREWQQVVFTCPDVRQEDISLPELDRPR